jgi:predicted DNA-binding transcriptional regulator AlpA
MAEVTLLSVRQVADVLGVHPRSVWRLAQTGDIPAPIRLSERVIRWRLTDLRDRLDEMAASEKGVSR